MKQPIKPLYWIISVAGLCLLGLLSLLLLQKQAPKPGEFSSDPPAMALPEPPAMALPEDADARQIIQAYADSAGLSLADWPQSLVALLERNPETREFVLGYPTRSRDPGPIDMSEFGQCSEIPLFLQWDPRWGYLEYGADVAGLTACGPMCLAMAGWYLTGEARFQPDRVIEFALEQNYCVPGNGTAWTLISQGAGELGLEAIEIPLDEARIASNLAVGNPIICVVGPGDFTTDGHFIVLADYDDGYLRVRDPNSRENSEKLWKYTDIRSQILNLWVIR